MLQIAILVGMIWSDLDWWSGRVGVTGLLFLVWLGLLAWFVWLVG